MAFIVKSVDTEDGQKFAQAVKRALQIAETGIEYVAFDCEGVNLSRIGTVDLISICFSTQDVYLVDYEGNPRNISPAQRILRNYLKRLLESAKVIKIVHDSRMDSDALFHLHDIKLTNVHDTSCFHHVITGHENKNLNDVLNYNNISTNRSRDTSMYQRNRSFWATRPISQTMIEWATSDVDKLYKLALKQLATVNGSQKAEAVRRSERRILSRNLSIATNLRVSNPGRFIGARGHNLLKVQSETGTIIRRGPEPTWYVYYPSASALIAVQRAMRG